MMNTIGMKEWNIDLLRDNVIKELEYRINNIKDLENIKDKNIKTTWNELKNTIEENLTVFANSVLIQKRK